MTTPDERARAVAQAAAANTQAWMEQNSREGPCCDFCCHVLVPGQWTTWLSKPFTGTISMLDMTDLGAASVEVMLDEQWAACSRCDAVIAEGDPEKLADNALANYNVERLGVIENRAEARDGLVAVYRAFYAGNPRRANAT